MSNLIEKLSEIQRTLNAPKNQFNNFGKYSYRNCEDILEALKPHLDGIIVTVSDEIKEVSGRIYVKATARITDGSSSIENTAYAREPISKKGMDESQITGSTSSYARKYALGGLFLIDDNKDADSMDNSKQAQQKSNPALNQSQLLSVMADGNDFNTAKFWRSMSQEMQEVEFRKLDKQSQNQLKQIMSSIPMETN